MAKAAEMARAMPGVPEIRVYKNNTDNKGASTGLTRTTLMSRSTPFTAPSVVCCRSSQRDRSLSGAGRVGVGQDGRGHGFQLSQRADFFEVEVGLETTLKRPMVNTRRTPCRPAVPPSAACDHRRREPAEILTHLKLGMTSLVLGLIEAEVDLSDL